MSTPETIPAPEEPKAAQSPKSKATLLLGLLSVLNLAATGFVAANVAFGYTEDDASEEVAEEHAEPAAEHGESKGGHGGAEAEEDSHGGGPIVALDPFVVNLNEPGSSRYLKATFEIEMMSAHSAADLKASKRNVRDEIFRYLSSLSVSDTLGEQSKARIQREVLSRIEREVGRDEVKKLFFTEFVVQ